MAQEKLDEKNECEHIYDPNEAMMAEKIRNAIEHYAMMKDGVHEECLYPCLWKIGSHDKCPWSCPWRIRGFIQKEEDLNFLIQDFVQKGEEKLEEENVKKVVKAVQQALIDPHPLPTEAKNKGKQKGTPDINDIWRQVLKEEKDKWEQELLGKK